MAGRPRDSATTGDVIRTLVIFFGLLALVAGFFALNRPGPRLPEPVDYQGVLAMVREQYPYDVLAPSPEREGWRATSVDHSEGPEGHRWRLGFVVDGSDFVGLEQSDGEITSYLRERLAEFDEDGVSRIGGDEWERWLERDREPDRALVRTSGGVVTIVRGTVSYDALEEFVVSLE